MNRDEHLVTANRLAEQAETELINQQWAAATAYAAVARTHYTAAAMAPPYFTDTPFPGESAREIAGRYWDERAFKQRPDSD